MTTPQSPSEPAVGPEFGLEPRQTREFVQPPLDSVDLLTNTLDYRGGSEYGGVGGLVQPSPHVPTASERLMQIYAIDPTDDGTRTGSVVAPEVDGAFNSER